MVYAKISIGILGFIVWSYIQMALPYCEIGVIDHAICQNSLKLLGTLYSKNSISYTQLAGNRLSNAQSVLNYKGSTSTSETTRERYFNFENFYTVYKNKFKENKIDPDWLIWFIGFVEGDGAILTYGNRLELVITQKDKLILDEIKEMLGFGKVSNYKATKLNNEINRFKVSDNENIFILAHLFNGNLILKHRQSQIRRWIDVLNTKRLISRGAEQIMLPIPIYTQEPTLCDPWISGFTDAEGCFNINITTRKEAITGYRVTPRYLLDQKNDLSTLNIINYLFGFGRVRLRSGTKDVYRYSVDSFKGITPIINYFNNFPLKTKKRVSFLNWCTVYYMLLNKEHLTDEGLSIIREIKKTINLKNSLTRKTGSSSAR